MHLKHWRFGGIISDLEGSCLTPAIGRLKYQLMSPMHLLTYSDRAAQIVRRIFYCIIHWVMGSIVIFEACSSSKWQVFNKATSSFEFTFITIYSFQ
jgi:hypothetical protein